MSAKDYLNFAMALLIAHKYWVVAALVLFEGVLVMTLVQRVVVRVSEDEEYPGSNFCFASNAFRNALVMGASVIFLASFDAAWITIYNKELLVTPVHWSVTMASLVSGVFINAIAWLTLARVKNGLLK